MVCDLFYSFRFTVSLIWKILSKVKNCKIKKKQNVQKVLNFSHELSKTGIQPQGTKASFPLSNTVQYGVKWTH